VIPTTHQIEMRRISSLKPYAGNARTHSKKQIKQIATSIQHFGFTNPVLVSNEDETIAGHGRVVATKEIGLTMVPTLKLSHLSPAERRAYVLADNKLALNDGWDSEILAIELQALIDIDFDVSLTGFSLAEVDFTLDQAGESAMEGVAPVITQLRRSASQSIWDVVRPKAEIGRDMIAAFEEIVTGSGGDHIVAQSTSV